MPAKRLSEADVALIRESLAFGYTDSQLAPTFGVSARQIGRIRRGEQHKK